MSETRPLVVAALGGNALSPPDQPFDPNNIEKVVAEAVASLAPLAEGRNLIVTHGNGPQVGYLAQQDPRMPLDVLGAESEGWLGYVIEQALSNALPERTTLSLVTRVVVDSEDPGFARPTKPVGPVHTRDEAESLAAEHGWVFADDRGGRRRVVASPEPLEVVEIDEIGFLARSGAIVVCLGGGGIPIVRDPKGLLQGVEAVVDKDLASSLLASSLGAGALLLLTDVPGVYADWPARGDMLRGTSVAVLRGLSLAAGSMGPKVEAAARFVEAGGGLAAIGALDQAEALLSGEAGTILRG